MNLLPLVIKSFIYPLHTLMLETEISFMNPRKEEKSSVRYEVKIIFWKINLFNFMIINPFHTANFHLFIELYPDESMHGFKARF